MLTRAWQFILWLFFTPAPAPVPRQTMTNTAARAEQETHWQSVRQLAAQSGCTAAREYLAAFVRQRRIGSSA